MFKPNEESKMQAGILKRTSISKQLTEAEALVYVGYPGEIVWVAGIKGVRIQDGETLGGFVVNDANTLTLDEILNELSGVFTDVVQLNALRTEIISILNSRESVITLDPTANTLVAAGGTHGWKILPVPVTTHTSSSTNRPTFTKFLNNIWGLSYRSGKSDEAWCYITIPSDYKVGTAVYPFLNWACAATNTGTVFWNLEYTVAKAYSQGTDSIFSSTSSQTYSHVVNSGERYQVKTSIPPLGMGIPGDNLEPGSLILLRIARYGSSDSNRAAIHLFSAGIHYQIDKIATLNQTPVNN